MDARAQIIPEKSFESPEEFLCFSDEAHSIFDLIFCQYASGGGGGGGARCVVSLPGGLWETS